ncbi:MAG: diguanylate cyclase [Nitrospirae bacterium]|nr:diguanylate cyclase [Nitrospirota bacterium]
MRRIRLGTSRFRLRDWSIRTKVFLLLVGMVLGPLLLAAYEGDRVSRQALLDQGVRNLQAHAHRLADALDRLLAERQEEAAWIAAAPAFRHVLLTSPARDRERQAAREALHHMSALHGGRFAVFLFDAAGRLALPSDEALPQPAGIPARPFFAEALGGKPSASPPSLDGGKAYLYFGAPVQGEDARVAGVVVLRAAAEECWGIVDRTWQEVGPESAAIVTDDMGVRIARAGRRDLLFQAWAPLPPERAQQILSERRYGEGVARIAATEMPEVWEALREPTTRAYFTHRLVTGPRYHAAGVQMDRSPWIVTISIPEEAFLAPMHQHRRRVGLFILGVALLSVAVSLAVSRILTGKVRLLAQAAHEIAEGRLETHLPSHGGDELAHLTRSFNRMASAIRSQISHVSDLYAVALALIHARKREELIDRALERGTGLVRAHASALLLYDERRKRFGGVFAHGLPEGLLEEMPWTPTSPQGECFLKGAPVVASATPGRGMGLSSLLHHAGFSSSISLPLVAGEDRLGVLTLYDRERTEWGADQIVLLSAFAHLVSLALKSMQALEEEHRKTEHLTVLNEMAVSLASELDLKTLLEKIVQAGRLLVAVECGAILVLEEGTAQVAYFRCTGALPQERPPAYPPQGGVLWRALSEQRAVRLDNLTEEAGSAGLPPGHPTIRNYLGVPLMAKGRLIGEIYLVNRVGEEGFTQEDEDLLATLASQASIAVQNARLHQQAMTLAITDGLTGLFNYRHFNEILDRETEEARRHGRPLSLIMADLDFFKDYNDAYGHQAGDRLLQMIADVLRAAVREIDYVARYGGEEFAVILPDSDREGALRVAERIRSQLHQWQVPHASSPLGVVTLSLGVASLPADAESAERLLTRADAALYDAKHRGRNRVEVPAA